MPKQLQASRRDEINIQVGRRLVALRTRLGYGQHGGGIRFAREIDVAYPNWNAYERGTAPLDFRVALKVVQRFPLVSLDYIYRGKPLAGSVSGEMAGAAK